MRMTHAAKKDEDQPIVVSDFSRKSLVQGACRIAGLPVGKQLADVRKQRREGREDFGAGAGRVRRSARSVPAKGRDSHLEDDRHSSRV